MVARHQYHLNSSYNVEESRSTECVSYFVSLGFCPQIFSLDLNHSSECLGSQFLISFDNLLTLLPLLKATHYREETHKLQIKHRMDGTRCFEIRMHSLLFHSQLNNIFVFISSSISWGRAQSKFLVKLKFTPLKFTPVILADTRYLYWIYTHFGIQIGIPILFFLGSNTN